MNINDSQFIYETRRSTSEMGWGGWLLRARLSASLLCHTCLHLLGPRPFFLSLPHKHTRIFMNCFSLSHAHTQFACCSPFHVYFQQFNLCILSDSYVTNLTFCHQASAFLLSHAPSFFKSALDVVSPAPLLASRHYFEHVASTRGKKL